MNDDEPIVITFPSGRQVTLPRTPADAIKRENKSLPKRHAKPCQHIGNPVKVGYGCGSMPVDGVWECAIHSQCAPLVAIEMRPGIVACRGCADYRPADEPGLLRLVAKRRNAIKNWQAAGSPVRLADEIQRLLAICRRCPFFATDRLRGTYCGKCGCPINERTDSPTRNKLAMATERCPLEPPRW